MTNAEAYGHIVVFTIAGYLLLLGGWLTLVGLLIMGLWITFT